MIWSSSVLQASAAIFALATSTSARTVPGPKEMEWFNARAAERATMFFDPTCKAIQAVLSNSSSIYAPGSKQYSKDVKHWCSSTDVYSQCSVEPGSAADIAAILKVLANSTATFGVIGGGHSCAPGFSGAKGVNIAMSRFNEVSYNKATGIVKYGAGLIWDDVYKGLEPFDVKVTGGRVSGVGVAGFSLGGGYSFLTNQYGLTSDGIVAYDFITATGKILYVTRKTYPDLFFLLQGGFNNAGIVTNFYAKARPRSTVWGGTIFLDKKYLDTVLNLTAQFASEQNTDLLAGMLPTLDAFIGIPAIEMQLFYDKPSGPANDSFVGKIFNQLLALPSIHQDVQAGRTMANFTNTAPSDVFFGMRGTFSSVSLERLTPEILQTIKEEFNFYGSSSPLGAGVLISYDLEPFALAKSYPAASTTGWPHDKLLSPLNLYFAWPLGLSDGIFYNAIKKSTQRIKAAAIAQGQNLEGRYIYPNYALYDTPFEDVYGPNVAKLTSIAAKYDPKKVMARAGGFQFQRGPNTYNFSFPP
ncbi:hypothetical protein OC846_006223 [Tilletia horrida]|uniref:FAD-binding PCMH-type domain-containing protein n=1 Tax=Tilletia horrida TaxID=155126 RepID=A0AAN6JNU4_9BASI|nr:hypothetical protein OC846_006223 [Tilletia horrida]KAK0565164.1 hypothetical protein OC861_003899 [Tilletia horrida]